MKKIIDALAALFPFFRHGSFLVLAFLMFSLSSCFKQYYQTNTTHMVDSASLAALQAGNKHFIVHTPDGPFRLQEESFDNTTMYGKKSEVIPDNKQLLKPKGATKNPVSREDTSICLREVHLYTSQNLGGSEIRLTYSQISRMDVYSLDRKAIRASKARGIFIVSASTVVVLGALLGAIVAAGMHSWSSAPLNLNL